MNDWRNEFSRDMDDTAWALGTIFFKVGIPVIVLSVIIGGIFLAISIFSQSGKIVDKTLDADNVIYNYEWFKQMTQDLDAMEKKILITKKSIEDFKKDHKKPYGEWSFGDKEEMSRLRTDLRGQEAHFEQLKADFKARSKMANRAIFKDDAKIIKWVEKLVGVK